MKVQGKASKTWVECRIAILKQFLQEEARDEVLTTWRSSKLLKNNPLQRYVERFWDANLKAMVYKKIDFAEQKQQYYAGLSEEIHEYMQAQRPKTIVVMIHHTRVATKITWKNQGQPQKENKPNVTSSNVPISSNAKAKKQSFSTLYKDQNKISIEELEAYKKEGKYFRCGKIGHTYKTCPQRRTPKDPPQGQPTT